MRFEETDSSQALTKPLVLKFSFKRFSLSIFSVQATEMDASEDAEDVNKMLCFIAGLTALYKAKVCRPLSLILPHHLSCVIIS